MIENAKSIHLRHQRLWLLPQKAIYWQKKKTLLIADLHIGKSGHFRRNGIPVPQQVNAGNFNILDQLIQRTEPQHIIFLGDLFHSKVNEEWNQLREWRQKHASVKVTLVIGNHDILPNELYHASHISIFKRLKIDPFLLVHDIEKVDDSIRNNSFYLIGGHIHPAVKLKGKGRQRMTFPCFYFGETAGVLPAFGQFTGTSIIRPTPEAQTYFIVESQIFSAHR